MTTPEPSGTMSFLEHLEELRRRLIICLVALAVAFTLCYAFSAPILNFLLRPLREHIFERGDIVYIHLTEPFLIYIKAAFFGSLFLASPVIFYQIWAFVAPGLHPHERRWAWPFLVGGPLFFIAGAAFSYIFLLPLTSRFLVGMGQDFRAAITLRSAFAFEFYFLVGMGLVFQLPIVVLVMARIGLVTPRFLVRNFRWAILLIFILAAILTPTPDVVTQTVFAAPMIALYGLSIVLALLVSPSKEARRRARPEEPAKGGAAPPAPGAAGGAPSGPAASRGPMSPPGGQAPVDEATRPRGAEASVARQEETPGAHMGPAAAQKGEPGETGEDLDS